MTILLFCLALGATPGCYYSQLASGQSRLLLARQPIDELLADGGTPSELRDQLELVRDIRRFAAGLGLEVGGKYTSYAPWPGDRVITSVVATRPGEIDAVLNCFPIVGCVPYRGYFERETAERHAATLTERGLDVCVSGVAAYSTLGWFDDPVTDPMLRQVDIDLVETLLHELVHATVFVASDADFNEGVASFVGREAALRYFALQSSEEAERARDHMLDKRDLSRAVIALRDEVSALYTRELAPPQRDSERLALERSARSDIAALPLRNRSPEERRALAQGLRLNDACLALRGTYSSDEASHREALRRVDDDLARFVARLREIADADDPRAALFEPSPSHATKR